MAPMRIFGAVAVGLFVVGCGSDPVAGARGEQGHAGVDGAKGEPGALGPAGAKGEPGAAGVQGPAGAPGKDGEASPTRSGTRIRARVLLGADGSRVFLSWVDTMTGQPCQYIAANDGQTRCLPAKFNGPSLAFSDAACTSPIFLSLVTGLPASYGKSKVDATAFRYFKIGAQQPTPAAVFQLWDNQCNPADGIVPNVLYYSATELPESTFVEAIEVTE